MANQIWQCHCLIQFIGQEVLKWVSRYLIRHEESRISPSASVGAASYLNESGQQLEYGWQRPLYKTSEFCGGNLSHLDMQKETVWISCITPAPRASKVLGAARNQGYGQYTSKH